MKTFLPSLNESSANIQEVKNRLPIVGLTKGQAVNFAECCNPLPGENIVGAINRKKGINVHLISAQFLKDLLTFLNLWYRGNMEHKVRKISTN